jgi:hypothetical protein
MKAAREAIKTLKPLHNKAHRTQHMVPQFDPRELEAWIPGHRVASILGVSRNTAQKITEHRYIRGVRTHLGWLADPHSVEDYRRRS